MEVSLTKNIDELGRNTPHGHCLPEVTFSDQVQVHTALAFDSKDTGHCSINLCVISW
jgi:hypothetical protein